MKADLPTSDEVNWLAEFLFHIPDKIVPIKTGIKLAASNTAVSGSLFCRSRLCIGTPRSNHSCSNGIKFEVARDYSTSR